MGIKITALPVITSSSITDAFVMPVGTASETDQLTLAELQASFTGLRARTTAGLGVFGKTVLSGVFVGNNGYVGIDNVNPQVALDVGDISTNGNAQVRISGSTAGRKVSFSLQDPAVKWNWSKRASDTDLYLEVSQDYDANITGLINIDTAGNVGLFNGAATLTDKFYVSGGNIKFEKTNLGISFLPETAEIKTSTANDILYINKTNNDDVVIGNNLIYVDNDASTPHVGINNITPAYLLDVSGQSQVARFHNDATTVTSFSLTNTSNTGYFVASANSLNIGPTSSNSANNIVYKLDSKKLGLGTTAPDNKLHVFSSTESRLAKLEGTYTDSLEVFQVNNYDTTGPRTNIYTFGRADSSGPTNNVKKWGVGLYDDGTTNTYQDVYAWYVDADTTTVASIKAYLDRNGNLDIKGGITTSGLYTKGTFIQTFKSRVNATSIYFDPTTVDASSSSPDSHTASQAPFSVMPYAGRVEKVQLYTSMAAATLAALSTPRIEIAAITPTSPGSDNATAFVASPAVPTQGSLGIIGYYEPTLAQNSVITINRSQFVGTTSFSSGQLLQYRICQTDGTLTACNFTVESCISFQVQ